MGVAKYASTWKNHGSGASQTQVEAETPELFAADEAAIRQRRVDEGLRLQEVLLVEATERRVHLAALQLQVGGQGQRGEVAFLDLDAVETGGEEDVGLHVRVDVRLEGELELLQLQVQTLGV